LEETGADAVMSAEGQLYNAALFASSQGRAIADLFESTSSHGPSFDTGLHLPHADLALEYLSIVASLRTPTHFSAVKGHLFKLMRPGFAREHDLRDRLGRLRGVDLQMYVEIAQEMKRRMDRDAAAALAAREEIDPASGIKVLPHWLAQPYIRPLPEAAATKGKFSFSF